VVEQGSPAGRDAVVAGEDFPEHARAHLLRTSVSRLNRLRAAVLGGNDGVTSTAGLVVGVAGATTSTSALLIAGVSGVVAGSLSMGGGEFTSVSAQRDSQDALLAQQRHELETVPDEELDELAHLYVQKGLSTVLAHQVAAELTSRDALAAHADIELGIDLDDLVRPWDAAIASAVAFALGAGAGVRPRGGGDAGRDRQHRRTARSGPVGPGDPAQRGRRHARDGDHLRHRSSGRHGAVNTAVGTQL